MEKAQEARFWRRVKSGGLDECWEWTGSLDAAGYGVTSVAGQRYMTHRLAWSLENGEIPNGLVIRHMCHNPPCCNPNHLKSGTKKQNSEDMVAAGRSSRGPNHWSKKQPHRVLRGSARSSAKLTDDQVIEIRKAYSEGRITQAALAARYGLDHSAVSAIVCGVVWTHLPLLSKPPRGSVPRDRSYYEKMKARTHCKRGHEFTEENTKQVKGGRACRTCERDWQREHARQEREKERGGRSLRPSGSLREESIMPIRSDWSAGRKTQVELAVEYGVSTAAIASVVHGRAWKHLPLLPPPTVKREGDGRGKNPRTRKQFCRNGHERSKENVYLWRGQIHCRPCGAETAARRYALKKEVCHQVTSA